MNDCNTRASDALLTANCREDYSLLCMAFVMKILNCCGIGHLQPMAAHGSHRFCVECLCVMHNIALSKRLIPICSEALFQHQLQVTVKHILWVSASFGICGALS